MKPLLPLVLFSLLAAPFPLAAQEFGFGFDDASDMVDSAPGAPPLAVSLSGKVGMELLGYVNELDEPADATLDGNFRGALNFEAEGPGAKAVINLDVNPPNEAFISGWVSIDEAYLQASFGDFELEGGLRKLTWGKADSMGPLDVINPYDYSNLTTLTDVMEMKVAQPLIHGSYRVGSFSKIEAVVLPWFSPHRFAEEGRWAQAAPPSTITTVDRPGADELSTLNYFQAGARFTTTVGSADIGAQYFYGRMYQPAQKFTFSGATLSGITIDYNRYHQIGVDYAQVIADFNIRAEVAANITEDLSGDDGGIYNPSIAWSLGFDRDLVWGINLNLQCNESIRLMDDEVQLVDTEAGKDITSTLITAALSKKFLRDELELKTSTVWDIENGAALIVPAIVWTKNDVALELSGGIFAGGDEGLFGQFHDNSFIRVGLKYTF
jgi:hypothetical protein